MLPRTWRQSPAEAPLGVLREPTPQGVIIGTARKRQQSHPNVKPRRAGQAIGSMVNGHGVSETMMTRSRCVPYVPPITDLPQNHPTGAEQPFPLGHCLIDITHRRVRSTIRGGGLVDPGVRRGRRLANDIITGH